MAVPLVKPDRTKPQNDRHDAAAIGDAVSRPQRRCVPIKTGAHQAVLTVPRARDLVGRERTAVATQLRGLFLEDGIIRAAGLHRLRREVAGILSTGAEPRPPLA